MKVLLSRWQFGVTITYHFLFVPLTIGLAFLVAIMQVLAYWRRDEVWERLTRFFGTLFLINFAMGVVTGIVQEFQFGMNWSNYSVFVGNIFGAPLAMEGPLAFFAESTFIALWMFRPARTCCGTSMGSTCAPGGRSTGTWTCARTAAPRAAAGSTAGYTPAR
jgi:cytochrome d ubiquinol oxidase subunit I